MSGDWINPLAARVFRFGQCRYDPDTGEVSLSYYLDAGPELVERLVFPNAPRLTDSNRRAAFAQALNLLHLIAGVSYYKAAVPPEVQFDGPAPNAVLAGFLTGLYVHGLAEFGFVNQLDIAGRLQFHPDRRASPEPRNLLLRKRALVAIGGGKDSLVGLDLIRRAGLELMPACIGASELIGDTVAAAGYPLLRIARELAPGLKLLNDAGAYNGHVPVTAINSAVLACAAVLYGFRYVVFSNERSADEATLVTPDGVSVNHQYSKTSAFERAFRNIIHTCISPDIEYFSILRPFSELDIIRRFSQMTRFHTVYSSCNRNFHLHRPAVESRWCGNCPKCRFAALTLAVFLEPEQVSAIQGVDLLNDSNQLDGFRAICGLAGDKPFECVGEIGESRAALAALAESPNWRFHAVVQTLIPELKAVTVPSMAALMRPSTDHFIPDEIAERLSGELG